MLEVIQDRQESLEYESKQRHSYLALGLLSTLAISVTFTFITLENFLRDWSQDQQMAEQLSDKRLYNAYLQRCEATWPLKGSNYENCARRARRSL